jgi:hypothetical protein
MGDRRRALDGAVLESAIRALRRRQSQHRAALYCGVRTVVPLVTSSVYELIASDDPTSGAALGKRTGRCGSPAHEPGTGT